MALIMKCLLAMRFISIILVVGILGQAFAQTDEASGVVGRQAAILDVSNGLETGTLDLMSARDQLRLYRSEARLAAERLNRERDLLQQQLLTLGPAPELGNVEPIEVSDRRASLLTQSAELSALAVQARLNAEDANRLLAGLSERQRAAFFSETLKPDRSALRPSVWSDASRGSEGLIRAFVNHVKAWRDARAASGTLMVDALKLMGVLAFALLLFWPLRRWINAVLSTTLVKRTPSEFQRYTALLTRILTRVAPGVIGGFALISVLDATGLFTPSGKSFVFTVWQIGLLYLAAEGMALGLFAPREPEWRIIPLTDKAARRARWLSVASVLIVGLAHIIAAAVFVETGGRELTRGVVVIEGMLISAVIAIALLPSTWRLIPERSAELSAATAKRWAYLRGLGLPMIIGISGALLLGYLNLAAFLSSRAVWLVGLLVWIWIARNAIMASLRAFDASFMARRLDPDAPGRKAMLFWAGLVVDLFIIVAAAPMFALLVGIDAYSVRGGFIDAFTGISIGNFTLSLADIFAAIATFFVILLVTRFLQRALDARLFTGTNADEGFRNSFRTLLGYAGLIIALFAAIGVIGLDLSNLAIIAGALSVGIGFGLQSIVNNFVSGLILLFERPVKVGDWVVTSSGEGFIKKISVRSTEIETFDRATVIVPNSELISNSVKNWTHKDRGGRVIVPVGVAYNSDVKKVRELLYQVASEHPQILKTPPPFVYFKEFGESSLDIELRFFIRNIPDTPVIRNDVRFAILDVFRAHGIEIPFPQRDVHMKSD